MQAGRRTQYLSHLYVLSPASGGLLLSGDVRLSPELVSDTPGVFLGELTLGRRLIRGT